MNTMDVRFRPVIWLQEAGFKAYLVGNQARNKLLGNDYDPKDIDIATSALPQQVIDLLYRHGIMPVRVDDKFGVVTFQLQGSDYEVTTFRHDIYDEEFNHIRRAPVQIDFVQDVKIDALRRDFTVNAIYFNPKTGQHLDPVDGCRDLQTKILRFIGDPEIRIKEDPLRVLRAIRFKFGLGFKYDLATQKALKKFGGLVHKLSDAILKKEFQKIQNLPNYSLARKEMQFFGVLPRF